MSPNLSTADRDRPYRRGPLLPMTVALACGIVVGVGVAGCGSSTTAAAPRTATSSITSTSAASALVTPSTGIDDDCGAALDLTAALLAYPGTGPTEAAPSAGALTAWAAQAGAPLAKFRAIAPSSLTADLDDVAAAHRQAATGQPVDLSDPDLQAGTAGVENWIFDRCGFPRWSSTDTPDGLVGIPDTLPTGPISVSFRNTDGATGFVLLVARVNDGVPVTVDDLIADRLDLTTQARVVMALSAAPDGEPVRSSARLTPGTYAVVSPQGTPPTFTGYHAALITVT